MIIEKRTIIIIAAIFGVAIISLAVIGFTQSTNKGADETVYTDPGSGEKIINGSKATQGTEASLENVIIYPGFSTLLDRGLTPIQVQLIQSTIFEYSLQQKDKFKEVSLAVDSFRHILPQGDSATHTLTFNIKVNRSDNYFISVQYENTTAVITKLYKSDKTTLLIER